MREIRWMVLGLLLAWGVGLAARLFAQPCPMDRQDAGMMLAAGPGGDAPELGGGPGMGPGGPGMGPGGPEMGPGGPGMGPDLMEKLDLTQAQRDQLKTLRRARRPKMQAAENALQDAREDLMELMDADSVGKADEDKLRAKHAELQKLEAALADERFESMLEVRHVLTASQRKKLTALRKERPQGPRRGRDHTPMRDGAVPKADGDGDAGRDRP